MSRISIGVSLFCLGTMIAGAQDLTGDWQGKLTAGGAELLIGTPRTIGIGGELGA